MMQLTCLALSFLLAKAPSISWRLRVGINHSKELVYLILYEAECSKSKLEIMGVYKRWYV